MEVSDQLQQKQAGGLSANALKLIAIFAMLIDHTADGFLTPDTWPYVLMRLVGRITGPTMFYFVTVGYRHTRNVNRYTLRLAGFALLSYLPYLYFHTGGLPTTGTWYQFNVIYTICIGLLAVRLQNEISSLWLRVPALMGLGVLSIFGDWGFEGFLIMLAFDFFYSNRAQQVFAYLLIAGSEDSLFMAFLYPFYMLRKNGVPSFDIYPTVLIAVGLLLPVSLLGCYNGCKGRGGAAARWGFYVVYPLHFLVLGAIKYGVR